VSWFCSIPKHLHGRVKILHGRVLNCTLSQGYPHAPVYPRDEGKFSAELHTAVGKFPTPVCFGIKVPTEAFTRPLWPLVGESLRSAGIHTAVWKFPTAVCFLWIGDRGSPTAPVKLWMSSVLLYTAVWKFHTPVCFLWNA